MKQSVFIFSLLLLPRITLAGDPVSVFCDCENEKKGLDSMGLLSQYHIMLSALEKAKQSKSIGALHKLYNLKMNNFSEQLGQDRLYRREILNYCKEIAGDSDKVKVFLKTARDLRLLKDEEVLDDIDSGNIDDYKARLACVAVQSRKDTLPSSEDSRTIEKLKQDNEYLKKTTWNWIFGCILSLMTLLILGIWGAFWNIRKNKELATSKKLIESFQSSNTLPDTKSNIPANPIVPENENLEGDENMSQVPDDDSVVTPTIAPFLPTEIKKLYARAPSGNILFQVSDIFEAQMTYFVIEINPADETTGKLSLVDDDATLSQVFSMPDSLRDACKLQGTGTLTLAQVKRIFQGKVVLEGGYWKITDKIILEW